MIIHWARLYDLGTSLFGGKVRALHRSMLAAASIRSGERVLDVGCGPGRLTVQAARAGGAETLGIDASPEMIALAQKRGGASYAVAGVEKIPSQDAHYDVVLASLMLHHLTPEAEQRGLDEIRRVLKPGGRLVVGEFRAAPGHGAGHLGAVMGWRRGDVGLEHVRHALRDFSNLAEGDAPRGFCVIRATRA
jgi:ubiquinone/menaquinone biosynthesis C-methylase UbiE